MVASSMNGIGIGCLSEQHCKKFPFPAVLPRTPEYTARTGAREASGRGTRSGGDSWIADSTNQIYLVADGMGGPGNGEIASALAASYISRRLIHDFLPAPGKRVRQEYILSDMISTVQECNNALALLADQSPKLTGFGTTLTMAVIREANAYLVHVGDSRAYLWSGGKLRQLTKDDTEPEGTGPRDLEWHLGKESLQLQSMQIALSADDVLLLTTDGLTKLLSHEELAQTLRSYLHMPLGRRVNYLLARAEDKFRKSPDAARGSHDDLTVMLIKKNW
jgi:PPM family protein phosphatase